MNLLKKMTPMMLATMLLAPSILINEANAQERRRRGDGEERGRRGDRDDRRDRDDTNVDTSIGSRGRLVQEVDLGNWDRRYMGRRSFHLIDDQEFKDKSDRATQAHKIYMGKVAALDAKEKVVLLANKTQEDIEKSIGKLSQAIVDALSEKTTLTKKLPELRQQLGNLKTQEEVAEAGASSTQAKVDAIKASIQAAEQNLKEVEDACAATPAADCNAKITAAKNAVDETRAPLKGAQRVNTVAQNDLKAKKEKREAKEKEIQETRTKIATLEKENTERANTLETKKQELTKAKAKVTAEKASLTPIRNAYQQALSHRNEAMRDKNHLKEILTTRILRINSIGASVGEEAGSIDGDYYAEYVGIPEGQRDGDRDGTHEGTRVGQDRSYARGQAQGEIEGRAEAEADGQREGRKQGTYEGHVAAASEDGHEDGVNEANNSDAPQVGTQQGLTDGLARAKREGKRAGEAIGEKQAIEKHETKTLESAQVDGSFAGAFAPVVPDYPGFNCITRRGRRYHRDEYDWRGHNDWRPDHQICPNFRPRKHSELSRTRRPILRRAFMDAYLVSYRANRRGQFVQSIDNYYLNAYTSTRDAAYNDFSNREYSSYTERGRDDGFRASYDARFPIVKEEYRQIAYSEASENPDTQSPEYVSTYKRVKDAAYNARYEEIRMANYRSQEQETFDENIEEQTEIFRKSRFAEVDKVYENHPVLKFVSSDIADGGIGGIAKADGIYQPGETTLHNVTIMNYGKKAASGVTISMQDGQQFKLPAIPGKKATTVKGAAKSKVSSSASIGSTSQMTLKVFSPLTAETKIQGRHYYATSAARLNSGDKKNVAVKYPMTLSSLKTGSELLINQRNALNVTVSNVSNRKYEGPLTIELNVDSQTEIITEGFNKLNGLSGSQTLKDAKVLVASERDVYRPLNFSAKIMKQGVILGTAPIFNTMAKAPFSDKNGKPVFLVDSDANADDLLRALESIGGLANASVIDLSLSRLNADVLRSGVNKKTIVALDNLRGSTMKGVAALLKNSEDSVMLFVDSRNSGISHAERNSVMKNAAQLPVSLAGNNEPFHLRFTNPFVDGVKDMNVVAQTTPRGMTDAIATLSRFMKTNKELVHDAGEALNAGNVLQANPSVQAMIAMASGEIMTVSQAMKSTGSSSYEDTIKDDKRLYKMVLEASGKKVKRKTLSKNLAAITMYQVIDRALDHFDPMDDNIEHDIEKIVEDELRDVVKGSGLFRWGKGTLDNLKDFDKGLYNRVDENPYKQSPFKGLD